MLLLDTLGNFLWVKSQGILEPSAFFSAYSVPESWTVYFPNSIDRFRGPFHLFMFLSVVYIDEHFSAFFDSTPASGQNSSWIYLGFLKESDESLL